tara:strand:+ start:2559 stop:3014 length:456 start_codon:yes stop_codon:yes gene_type:complete
VRLRTIIGLAVIIIGLFWVQIQERIPDIVPDNTPSVVITIDEPSQEIKEKVSSIADLVTDEKDRLNLCIFNKVFAERVGSYDADAQQINDVYTEAAKIFFGETLKGKYEGYGSGVTDLMSDVVGDENHKLTKEEKDELSNIFNGLAWHLNQ